MSSANFSAGGDPAGRPGATTATATAAGQPTAPARPPASPMPAVVGILIAGAAILLLGLWLGRDGLGGTAERPVPQLTLLEPAPGVPAGPAVRVVFETRGLAKAQEGWRAGRLHLHAVVDGVELMPAAADIEPLGEDRYAWPLAPLAPGVHTLQLRWSGPDHAPLVEGASETVRVEVSPPSGGAAPTAPATAPAGAHHGAHTP